MAVKINWCLKTSLTFKSVWTESTHSAGGLLRAGMRREATESWLACLTRHQMNIYEWSWGLRRVNKRLAVMISYSGFLKCSDKLLPLSSLGLVSSRGFPNKWLPNKVKYASKTYEARVFNFIFPPLQQSSKMHGWVNLFEAEMFLFKTRFLTRL